MINCEACDKEFIPKQKYCCVSCRVNGNRRNGSVTKKKNGSVTSNAIVTKADTISVADVKRLKPTGFCKKHNRVDCWIC